MKKLSCALLLGAAFAFSAQAADTAPRWPDFPAPIKNGAGARIGATVYAGLGSAGKAWYALDTGKPGAPWVALAPFPDAARDAASAVAINGLVYIFGGSGKNAPEDKALTVFDTAYVYDPAANSWRQLPTRAPLGIFTASVVSVDQRNIVFFGGVNKAIFDGYFQDYAVGAADNKERQAVVAGHYFDQRPQDYLWTAQVMSYNPQTNQWRNLGTDPQLPTVGAGVAVHGQLVTMVNGEIKPGLRSPNVKEVSVDGDKLTWKQGGKLPAPPGAARQEGVAGSFAGYSNNVLLVAGGANFPGAWQQFDAGQNYAHKGLKKTWRDDIYARRDGKWWHAGKLPAGMGYGTGIQLDDGVLLIGGELDGGAASKDVFLLQWDGKAVRLVH
ncbi:MULTISPECIES: N-acetylneuraminate epimerase [unclassified Janthinobacterium]|uniref:N-acetylneuraminate epimerase n=1 Tax=unclassified Janthinobacterium TaxID=2610881 RepID=UPI000889AC6C|nr:MULTISPECIES: N-acetylneuraminate epimerase [unclassified Janthinobacterium]SDA58210.1 N-acetylneuraminate epimerase [Janthinobacterium sp. 551a]SFB29671.1 N-acetylneuraminate epimerase [Janthinobacterium sp. 344]